MENNNRKRPVAAEEEEKNVKRPRLMFTETTNSASSCPVAGDEQEAAMIIMAICHELIACVCGEDTLIADSLKTVLEQTERKTAENPDDYLDESILRSYEYWFGDD